MRDSNDEHHNDEEPEDRLSAMRGIGFGLAISLLFWIAVWWMV